MLKNIGPIYHDAVGAYIIRRSFTDRNGKLHTGKNYKIYLR